jgi:hypothetical protein
VKHFMHMRFAVVVFAATSLVLAGAAAADRGMYPDDRVVHSPAAIDAGQSTDLAPDDRIKHHPASLTTIAPVTARASLGGGFDWDDAAIGAATVFGLVLLGAGGLLVLRQRRGPAFS